MPDVTLFHMATDEGGHHRKGAVRSIAFQTGLSISEVLRRMVDRCLTEEAVNEIVPSCSGRVVVGVFGGNRAAVVSGRMG